MLRDFGIDRHKFIVSDHSHKLEKVRRVLRLFSTLPFLLIGDGNQQDPDLYLQIAGEFPGRILAIYIHQIARHGDHWQEKAAALGIPLLLISSAQEAEQHCEAYGWIKSSS